MRNELAGRLWPLAALALVTCGGSDAMGPSGPGNGGDGTSVEQFVAEMNAHRLGEGCTDLAWHAGVATVAQDHSQDMVDRDYFSHTNPEGESPFDRLGNAGITWSGGAGENIAAGTSDASLVLELWLNSPGHRLNIENCAYTHHGVGLASGHWTHVFVTNPD